VVIRPATVPSSNDAYPNSQCSESRPRAERHGAPPPLYSAPRPLPLPCRQDALDTHVDRGFASHTAWRYRPAVEKETPRWPVCLSFDGPRVTEAQYEQVRNSVGLGVHAREACSTAWRDRPKTGGAWWKFGMGKTRSSALAERLQPALQSMGISGQLGIWYAAKILQA
jgi:hypothetical protein